LKILYIYNLYQQPGGENLWVESEPELMKSRGHGVVTYKRDNREIRNFTAWQKGSLYWRASWSRQSYREVRELIRRHRPDAAHVYNTLALVTPSVYYACRDEGVPVVQTLYNYRLVCPAGTLLRDGRICEECIDHSLWRSVRYRCYRHSAVQTASVARMLDSHRRRGTWTQAVTAYIVPTDFMRRKFVQGGLPAGKIVVKPNFHEPDPGLRESADGSALYIGRLTREKGVDTLLTAWAQMPNAPLLRIVGDGPLREQLAERVARESGGNIEILGPRPHGETVAYLKKASLLILPSEWYEGFPHVILEAFACGVPIVASRIGTLPDIIQDGTTGLLFEPGQPADLAAKVTWMIGHEDETRRMVQNGRGAYECEYTADRNYDRLLDIYQGAIEGRIAELAGAESREAIRPPFPEGALWRKASP